MLGATETFSLILQFQANVQVYNRPVEIFSKEKIVLYGNY
jgi:hypothetical protein